MDRPFGGTQLRSLQPTAIQEQKVHPRQFLLIHSPVGSKGTIHEILPCFFRKSVRLRNCYRRCLCHL
jgi:hypothetical protein